MPFQIVPVKFCNAWQLIWGSPICRFLKQIYWFLGVIKSHFSISIRKYRTDGVTEKTMDGKESDFSL